MFYVHGSSIFKVWTLSVLNLFRELLLEGVWHVFFNIWVPIEAPMGPPFYNFLQVFRELSLEAVWGWPKRAKLLRRGMAGGRGGACSSAFARFRNWVLHA